MEFSMTAFYDPARRALTPSLVPRHRLHLATTLDSFAWSLTGAVGSSLGGLAASKFGVQACFYIDAATYLFSAACAFRLKVRLPSLPVSLFTLDGIAGQGLIVGLHLHRLSDTINEAQEAEVHAT